MTRPRPFLTLQTALLVVFSGFILMIFIQDSSFAQQSAPTREKISAWTDAARVEEPPTGDQFNDVFLGCTVHGLRPTLEGYPIVGGRIAALTDDELIDVYRRWSGAAVEQSIAVAESAAETASELGAESVAMADEVGDSVTERASGLIRGWMPNGNDDETANTDEETSDDDIEDEGSGLIDYAAFVERAAALMPDILSMDALQELSSDAVDDIVESETMATVEGGTTVSYAFAYQMMKDPETCRFVVQDMIVDISVAKIVGGLIGVMTADSSDGEDL